MLSLLAAGLAGCCNSGQKQAAEQAVWPKLQATGEMPILAWHSIPSDCTTLERFREMKETGITHSFTSYPDADAMQRALDTAQAAGVKLIVSCPELEKEPEATVKRFMNHPATAGYFLRDEPNTESFAEAGPVGETDPRHRRRAFLLPEPAARTLPWRR